MNPYEAPKAATAELAVETQPVKPFSVSGRIGRLRYIAYGILSYVVLAVLAGVAVGALGAAGAIVASAVGIAMLAFGFMLTIQRCHDFNATGWLSILLLVPLANLIFWFIPGSAGPNRWGPPTPPNGTGVIAGVIVAPIAICGVLSAVAFSAYGDFTHRARVAEALAQGSAWRMAVSEHYTETRKLPSSAAELRKELLPTDASNRYGRATLGENGVITVTMSAQAGGSMADKTILIRPRVAGEAMTWDCTGGTLQPKYRPGSCRP